MRSFICIYLFIPTCIYLVIYSLFCVQHVNEGGGPCVAPEHHWLRAHVPNRSLSDRE